MIQEYKHPLLSGKPCMVNTDFVPAMDLFCRYLELSMCSAVINSSFRLNSDHIQGAVVIPAVRSNHFVGHGIDCNIIDKDKKEWTSEMLKTPKDSVLILINLIRRSTSLRWGGDFMTPDTIHFDDALNVKFPKQWDAVYLELHNPQPNA